VYWFGVCGRKGREGQTIPSSQTPHHMPSFDIPLGPPITERGCTYLVSEVKVCHSKHPTPMPPYGSITYDREKGEMPLKWVSENKFLVWLAAKENKNTIKFIVSFTDHTHQTGRHSACSSVCENSQVGSQTARTPSSGIGRSL